MQKKIIALAVAGLVSGATFAQSNVTIYGIADAGYAYSKSGSADGAKNPTFSGIESGSWEGSRIGFMGEEALGNGLKAIFRMEYGTSIDGHGSDGDSAGLYETRTAYVGLDTNYGTLTLGKLNSAADDYYGDNSSNAKSGNSALETLASAYSANLGGVISGPNTVINNAIAFQSKDYDGFSGRLMYGFGENPGSADPTSNADGATDGIAGISGKYNNGPLNIDAMYYTKMNQMSTDAKYDNKDTEEWLLGASYDFEVVKAFASYQHSKNKGAVDVDDGAGGTNSLGNAKMDVWSVGVSAPVSAAGTVMFEYAKATGTSDLNDSKDKSWGLSLGYTHDFSKRTMFYSSVGYVNNNKLEAGVASIADTGYKGVGVSDENNWSFLSGIRHSF